jgi:hypothetical protein
MAALIQPANYFGSIFSTGTDYPVDPFSGRLPDLPYDFIRIN